MMIWHDMICLTNFDACLLFVIISFENTQKIKSDKHYYCWCNKVKKWANTPSEWCSKDNTVVVVVGSDEWRVKLDRTVGVEEEESHISVRQPQLSTIGHQKECSKFSVQTNFLNLEKKN